MTRVTILYPAAEGRTFNMDYYLETHVPLFRKRMGAAMKSLSVERGLSGSMPGSPAPFVAIIQGTFESAEAFAAAFAPHAAEIQGDVPNYTDIQPIVQIGEVIGPVPF
ncbi:MAG: EthD family reductase [Acidobacteriia bacterium]|nr:EthD family reductase [Terriglobia bacterium]